MINKIFALPVVEQLTPVLSRRQIDGADVIVVDHPRVKASVEIINFWKIGKFCYY